MSKQYLENPISIKIYAKVEIEENGVYEGFLTNWDAMSCFIRFKDEGRPSKLRSDLKVIMEHNGKKFKNWGKLVSRIDNRGIGIIFNISEEKKFNWRDFYHIMDEISFTPEYLIQ